MAAYEDKSCEPDVRFKLLSSLADSVVVDKNIPPRRYLRSGLEMERMAAVYTQEGNIEYAFTLYMKYIVLFVEKLPKHPQYKHADQIQVKKVLENVKKIFPITEKLRKSIKELYQKEYKEWQEEQYRKIQEENERQRKKKEEGKQKKQEEENRQKQLEEYLAHQRDQATNVSPVVPIVTPSAPTLLEDYPTAPKIEESIDDRSSIPDVPPPPYTPPEDSSYFNLESKIPDVKEKNDFSDNFKTNQTPHVDRTTKPNSIYDRQISTLVNGMRRIYIPQELISRFLTLASMNTSRNLETCGILTGKLAKNLFHITHLVIPKQSATSDSCTTTNEEEMFDVQDKHDLVTLGWIHTHPSQTSFLSSVDLHTHYAYQVMLPEAIAIVCAPKFDQVGIYRLTTNHGMSFVGSCNKGGFHPHPKEPPLFEESEHVHMDTLMGLKIIDLR